MVANITRFYFDFDEDCRTGCTNNLAFEDVLNEEADEYEEKLKEQSIQYTRIVL
jgi:hypothetical protein